MVESPVADGDGAVRLGGHAGVVGDQHDGLSGAPQGVQRGGHAHKALRQLLWCPYGSILIRLDDGREKTEVLLDDPAKGLIVEHFMWREMIWQQDDSVLCVAADSYYDADDYIRDYDAFLQAAAVRAEG